MTADSRTEQQHRSIAVVVGGTRGIGRAIALALARDGCIVVPTGRALKDSRQVCDEISAMGGAAYAHSLDVTDLEDIEACIAGVAHELGGIDILVANAGISPDFPRAEEVTPRMWDELMAVNLRGAFFSVQAAGRRMLEAGGGSVVIISSVTAQVGTSHGMPYVASKGGLDAMTRTLAVEWADRGVRVNAVAPGYVATDMTAQLRDHEGLSRHVLGGVPADRFGTPEEVAAVVAHLAGPATSFVTGVVIPVDGGLLAS